MPHTFMKHLGLPSLLPGRPICVLVVEDEFLIMLDVVALLEEEGFVALYAGNSLAALILLNTHPEIQAVFTDVNMPGHIDGLMLASAVREQWPQIRIIVTSGRRDIGSAEMPIGSRFFSKPYNGSEVIGTIREMVAARAVP